MSPDGVHRRAVLLAPMLLAACGFSPAYAPGGSAERLRGRLAFEAPETPDGYRLRTRLEHRLGRATAPAATLAVDLVIEEFEAGVTPDGTITRYNLDARAPWSLVSASGDVLAQGTASGFAGYSATGSTVATSSAADDARERLAVLLAEEIVRRLLLLPEEALP